LSFANEFSRANILLNHMRRYGTLTSVEANIIYSEYFVSLQMGLLQSFGYKVKRRKNTDGNYEWYLKG